ncbi:MAG: polysulfide reductase NrfD [Campylobacteraceae bacterium]|nr:polysulfide reductase NrfD [Campylobacteraceae bacterium]
MEKIIIAGLEINKIGFFKLFFNKAMIIAYVLLAVGFYGIYEAFDARYFSVVANAHTAGLDLSNPNLVDAMKQAVFGHVGEVSREDPWTLYIVNYMYMIYTGSGVIFLVALAELMNIEAVTKAAAGFMALGLSMVCAGLFTIATDLNMLNMLSMLTSPNFNAGMWLMLPLYITYIPFVLFEIYLLITNKRDWAKKFALIVLLLSVGVDIIEYFIQAKLFSMNVARHLWTEFPGLTFYFIISAFVSSLGIMGLYAFFDHRKSVIYNDLMEVIRKAIMFFVLVLVAYEALAYLIVDKSWAFNILFGPFKFAYFGGYIFLAMVLPFLLTFNKGHNALTILASISTVVGGYIGRYLFVYGGNANPLSDRFGAGYEKYDFYAVANSINYEWPHIAEVFIVIGSFGVVLAVYKIVNSLFSVSKLREH